VVLESLAYRAVPEDWVAARALAAEVAEVAREHGETRALGGCREGLRELASAVWGVLYEQDGLPEILAGEVRRLDSGALRITYEFDNPEELGDFVATPEYLEARRGDRFELPADAKKVPLTIRGGNLEGQGALCYRHKLAFVTPTVRYELLYGRTRGTGRQLANLLVGLCDDGKGSFIGCWDLFDLEVTDVAEHYARVAFAGSERSIKPAKAYKVELKHDGRKVTLTVDGKKTREIACGPRQAGALFLWVHAEVPVAIKRLEIEGRLDPEGAEDARRAWIEGKLEQSGLAE
jgi:hypothetical protein